MEAGGSRGVARSKNVGWTHVASAEREPIPYNGVPEAETLLAFGCPTEPVNLPHSPYFANSLNPRYL